ncbi:MAG TPA: MFS transporter [Ktedonobacterales bacterium]
MKVEMSPRPIEAARSSSDFPLFWLGETISMFGTQVTLLALPLTAVLMLRATATELGLVRFLEVAPYVLFTLLFGAWVDRIRRKPVLIVANAARALLIGVIPLLAVLGLLRLPLLAAVAFGVGTCTVLFDVTWAAYLPLLVRREQLVSANGRMATSSSAAEVAGPGLGGLLIQLFTAPLALVADAISYAAATVTLLLTRTPEPVPAHIPRVGVPWWRALGHEIGEGIRVVWASGYLRAVMLMSGLWNLLANVADTVFLLYATRGLHLSPGTLGATFAAGAVGGLVGAAISTRLTARGTFGPLLGIAFTFGCVPWVILPAVTGPLPIEVGAFILAQFGIRMGLGLWYVLTLSLRQAITPPHLWGRVSATLRLVSYGLGALGFLISGLVATVLGLRETLWCAAAGFLIILVITLRATPLPRVRSLAEP